MPELARWLFHSPRRLYTACVAAFLLVLALVTAFTVGRASGNRPTAAAASRQYLASPAPSASAAPTAAAVVPSSAPLAAAAPPPPGPPIPRATAFVRAWAAHPSGQTQQQWLATVRPYATAKLAELLAYTDIVGQPNLTVAEPPTVRYSAATSAQVSFGLSDRSRVLVTLTRDIAAWQVFDIEPDAGDFGSRR